MSDLRSDARVLLVRLSALGDCLHAVPLLSALREQLPDVRIGWAIQRGGHQLLSGHPEVDRFHLFPRRTGSGLLTSLLRFRRELREASYDAVLDVQGLFKSGLASWLSGAPLRVGFAGASSREGNGLFVNRKIEPQLVHVVDRNLELLAGLGLERPETVRWSMPEYSWTESLERFVDEAGTARGEYVVVNPGTTWKTKHWPAEAFGALARRLTEELGRKVVLTWGSEAERWLCDVVREQAPGAAIAPATALRELAALLGSAALVVANDTGPLHLAVALGVTTVGLYGATDPERTGPYGHRHASLVAPVPLDCRPCHKKTCARHDLACLRDLPVSLVFDACRVRLEASAA